MSSRLHPGGANIEASPWVPEGSARTVHRARGGDPQVEMQLQEAYQKGFTAGESSGAQKAAAQIAPVLKNFASVIGELAAARHQTRVEAEESMVQLAIAIARRILHREIATDPEAILGLVRSVLERLNFRETHRIRLSPADGETVRQHRQMLSLPERVEIAIDPSLPPGSALFETARGEVDGSIQTQLDEIQRGFADLVRRGGPAVRVGTKSLR